MTSIGRHADDQHLESYAMGTLSDSEVETLEEHLLCCEQCRNGLDETEMFIRSMRGALKKERAASHAPSKPAQLRTRNWMPAYVGAFAIIGVLFLIASQFPRAAESNPLAVRLTAMRGAEGNTALAGRPLDLILDARDLAAPNYRVRIVDAAGRQLWESAALPNGDVVRAQVAKPLNAGAYFVRIYGPGPDLLREYSLLVR
jgi:adenine-specific DNA methylase